MRFVVACDSFKGCMTSLQACQSVRQGILKANLKHDVGIFPMCDGGEGTKEVLSAIFNAKKEETTVQDAYGKPIRIEYGIVPEKKMAIMEIASCIGLNLVHRSKRNPLAAHSKGVGMMLMDAIQKGCKEIWIGIGGSSTNDGGIGLLSQLGYRFYDQKKQLLWPNIYALGQVHHVDARNAIDLTGIKIQLALDVTNPLLGPEGATYTFGRQKGIYPSQMEMIDKWMGNYRRRVLKDLHCDLNEKPGSGAAGGIGGALMSVLGANGVWGTDLCIDGYGLKEKIGNCDIVITGEGQTDLQSAYGKVPFRVAQVAKEMGKPCFCLSGALGRGAMDLYQEAFDGIYASVDRAMDFPSALKSGPEKLENLAYTITKTIDALCTKG